MNRPFALSASIILLFSTADRMMTPKGRQVRAGWVSCFCLSTYQWLADRIVHVLRATRLNSTLIQGMQGYITYKSFSMILGVISAKESKWMFVDVENGDRYQKVQSQKINPNHKQEKEDTYLEHTGCGSAKTA